MGNIFSLIDALESNNFYLKKLKKLKKLTSQTSTNFTKIIEKMPIKISIKI